jgi:hypothetical protein
MAGGLYAHGGRKCNLNLNTKPCEIFENFHSLKITYMEIKKENN